MHIRIAFKSSFLYLVCQFSYAFAGPEGGNIVSGDVNIQGQGSGNVEIHQSSNKAIINWQTFNVGSGESVKFVTPGANAATLNRVVGQSPSEILGSVSSNGQLWLINPNGIMFGKNAEINVAGMVASTLNITDENFKNGNYTFEQQGANLAKIVNHGHINADGGYVAMIAPQIENIGIVEAKLGTVAIGAGTKATLDFQGNQLLHFAINDGADVPMYDENGNPVAALKQMGMIQANGGSVILTADSINSMLDQSINVEGIVKADTVEDRPGKIVLLAKGNTIVNNATLSTQGLNSGEVGGSIKVMGQNVGVTGNTTIIASGAAGGGDIRLGYDNRDPNGLEANATVIGSGVNLRAEAMQSGNGGYIETSGKYLNVGDITVSTKAANGKSGTWLLDPTDVNIVAGSGAANGSFAGSGTSTFTPSGTGNPATIGVDTLLSQLSNNGLVDILTTGSSGGSGNINIQTSIAYTGNTDSVLQLDAQGNITVNPGVSISDHNSSGTGNLGLTFNAVNGITFANGSGVNVHGDMALTSTSTGNITGNSVSFVVGGTTTLNAANQNIILDGSGNDFNNLGITTANSATITDTSAINLENITTTGGAVTINANGNITQATGTTLALGAGNLNLTTTNGNISQSGTAGITGSGNNTIQIAGAGGMVNLGGSGNNFSGALAVNNTTTATPLAFTLYNAGYTDASKISFTNTSNTFSSFSLALPSYNEVNVASLAALLNTSVFAKESTPTTFDLSLLLAGQTTTVSLGAGGMIDPTRGGAQAVRDVTLSTASAIALNAFAAPAGLRDLTVTTAGAGANGFIGQNAAVTSSGTATFSAAGNSGGSAISLANANNDFSTVNATASAGGASVTLWDANTLTLSGLTTNAGTVTVNSGKGGGVGTLIVSGNITTSGEAINLTNSGSGGVSIGADLIAGNNSISVNAASGNIDQTAGTISANGLASGIILTASTGAITSSAGASIVSDNIISLTTGSSSGVNLGGSVIYTGPGGSSTQFYIALGVDGSITMNNANNVLGSFETANLIGVGALTGLTLKDSGAITLGAITSTGAVNITGGNGITVDGMLNATGQSISLFAASGNISLNQDISAAALNLAVQGTAATINQTAGTITATGTTTLTNSGSNSIGAISLAQAMNAFATVVGSGTLGDVTLNDANALTLGTITASGLTVTAGDTITFNSGINLGSGAASLTSTNGSIIDGAGHTGYIIAGTTDLNAVGTGGSITLLNGFSGTSQNQLGIITVGADGQINLTDDSATTTINQITSTSSSVNVIGTHNIDIAGTISSGLGTYLTSNNGSITESGLGAITVTADQTSLTANNGYIELLGNNSFYTIGATAGITNNGVSINLNNTGALYIGQLNNNASGGNINLTGDNYLGVIDAITAIGGRVNLTTTGGIIDDTNSQAGYINAKATNLAATGNIQFLSDGVNPAQNSFGTLTASSTGGSIAVWDTNASGLTLGNITTPSNLQIVADHGITQANGTTIDMTSGTVGSNTATFNIAANGSGNITLGNSNNFNQSAINVEGLTGVAASAGSVGDVTIQDVNSTALVLNHINATGNVILAATHLINDGGSSAITVGSGSRWLIYLNNLSGNSFGTAGNYLLSGNQAIWNTSYPAAISQSGNRYVFATPETLILNPISGSMNVSSIYGDGTTLSIPVDGTNYSASGFVNAATYNNVFTQDTAANTLDGLLSFSSAGASTTANVGSYNINMSAPASNTNGYTLTTNNPYGTLMITARPITLKADDVINTYGDGTPSTDSYTVTSGNLVNSNTISSINVSAVGAGSQPNVGNYILQSTGANFGSGSASNYDISYENGTFTVNKATLTITADNKAKYQGGENPTLTASYSGFKYNDTESVVSGLTITTPATTSSPVGNYAITPANGLASNYSIIYVDGTLSVLPSGGGGSGGSNSGASGGVQPSSTVTNNPAVVANNVVVPQPLDNTQLQETNPNLLNGGGVAGYTNIVCHYDKENKQQECIEMSSTKSERG